MLCCVISFFFFFKQKTAYEVRISDWSSDVCSSDLLEYVRPAGRLDFSVGYDVTDRLRFDIGGTNVLRSRTRTYRGEPFFVGNYFYDETTYTLGVRYRF